MYCDMNLWYITNSIYFYDFFVLSNMYLLREDNQYVNMNILKFVQSVQYKNSSYFRNGRTALIICTYILCMRLCYKGINKCDWNWSWGCEMGTQLNWQYFVNLQFQCEVWKSVGPSKDTPSTQMVKVKVPRNRSEGPDRGRRIALLFLYLGASRGWVVSNTPRPHYPRKRPGAHCTEGCSTQMPLSKMLLLKSPLTTCRNLQMSDICSL
jgi:hypothetical protein